MNPSTFSRPNGRVIHAQTGFAAFLPNPLPPTLVWTHALALAMSEADRAIGALAGLSNALPDPHLLVQPFVRREAVLSSRIEGTRASLSDLYAFEAQQMQLFEPPTDVHEVHNYVAALEYGLKRVQTLPVSLRLLREIHARLMENVRGEHLTPGEFRRTPNWIGPAGSTLETAPFVPPPPAEMQQALGAFEAYLHAESDLPPLVRLGLVHYQFEAIHPFLDGNGRLGRLLVSLLLAVWDLVPQPVLYLSAYFESRRQAYYDHLMAVSQRSEWEEWLIFFLNGVTTQSQDAVRRIRRLQQLRERYREQVETTRAAARMLQVVDLVFARPLLTVSTVQSALKVQFPIAQRYIDRLVGMQILREITGRARNRVYQADEILSALDEPRA